MSKKTHETDGGISLYFELPETIPEERLTRIERLISEHGAVGRAFIRENLRNAHLIGYAAVAEEKIIGTMVLKHQKDQYRRRIEAATGLDLSGYLERGYTCVHPAWRARGIAGRLIRGLIERSPEKRVYVTIDLENTPALRLTRENGMVQAGTFVNPRTGRTIGVFVNR
jgi:GNAT superfamily N-acetyltransferase